MTARAFGKVILLGEHAVVYGVPALAVGIDRGAVASAERSSGASILELGGAGATVTSDDDSELARAFAALLLASRIETPVRVRVSTDLPAGAGLGCSAALGVAIARAVDELGASPATDDEIVARATEWERIFHGNPSGIDATVAAKGGCVLFVRGEGARDVHVGAPLRLAVGHSGSPSSTKTMVEAVATLRARRPEQVAKSFEGIRSLVGNARLAIEAGDVIGLGKLMDLNQMLLSGLFVSTTEIERMCDLARQAGALGAKLTGAGGGGCVVALVRDDGARVLEAWKEAGFEGFATTVGGMR